MDERKLKYEELWWNGSEWKPIPKEVPLSQVQSIAKRQFEHVLLELADGSARIISEKFSVD